MANVLIAYAGSSLYAFPVPDRSVSAKRVGTLIGPDLFSVSVDASVASVWYLFSTATPTDWNENIGLIDLSDYGYSSGLTVWFVYLAGLADLPRAMAKSSSFTDWNDPTIAIPCDEIDTGLYRVELATGFDNWSIFDGDTQPTSWNDALGEIFLTGDDMQAATGSIANILAVDYEDDWEYLDGIEDVGFAFDSARVTSLTAPSAGVKAKRASPSHNEIVIAAATIGYEQTDLVFVVFAQTLMDGTAAIKPSDGDKLIAFDCTWVIKSVKTNVDHSQYRCLCRRTTKEQ